MGRKKILWLCSWYPDRMDPFNGDFIQRHAIAAALYNDIYVIHVAGDISGGMVNSEKVVNKKEMLTEHIVYFNKRTGVFGKFISYFHWLFLFKKAIRNYIITNGKPDMVHVHVPMKAGILALWLKKRYKIPFVVTEHWGIYNEIEEHNYQSKNWVFKNYTQKIFSEAAKFISVSKFLAEGVRKLVVNKEFSVLPNVVNTELFYFKERNSGLFRFVHVSNMVKLKNADGIVRAFHKLLIKYPETELVMVGDKDSSTMDYAYKLGLSIHNVSFRGEVAYGQVAKEIQNANCLLLFSNIENSPCVIGEALCCGVPVIVSAVGGVPELVNDTNALLVEKGNESELLDAMIKMMEEYYNYNRQKIAKEAQNKFSYSEYSIQLDAAYSLLITRTDT